MHRLLRAVEVRPDDVVPAVRAALDGTGPALAPLPPGGRGLGGDAVAGAGGAAVDVVPDGVALVVTTSGSTGEPRAVLLDAAALEASAHATHERLGGPGRWLLCLPVHHVAGLQVVVRSLLAGTTPLVALAGRFDPAAVAARLADLPAGERPRYVSLVPTQVHRILAAAGDGVGQDRLPDRLRAWAGLDAILVGGAATPPALLERGRRAGLRLVTTYGATETGGGCVYDGVPLAGVTAEVRDGVVHLAGPTLARGYLSRPDLDAAAFPVLDGRRWFRTGDAGEVADGRLVVHGRLDDVVVTGGVKVAPAAVEAALAEVPGVGQVCVVGVPDDEWGAAVVAVVVPDGAPPALDEARAAVRRTLGPAAAPRRLLVVDALPERGPGKVDRAAVARLAAGRG